MPLLPETEREERATAVRALLARPLLARDTDPDTFTLVAAHHRWLAERFEDWCGWPLRVDFHAGTARLTKRRAADTLDASRPARRPDGKPLSPYGYSLLMSTCAELVSRPHTTIGDVADALAAVTASDEALRDFDATDRTHRSEFVDVLRWLVDGGFLTVTTGDLDQYAGARVDAVLRADVKRLAVLLAPVTPPSRVAQTAPADTAGWLTALADEPRYGDEASRDDTQRTRWARHQLLRSLLDDPATDVDALPEQSVAYLRSITGRRVVVTALKDAGLVLERHAEVLLGIDPTRQATDVTFGERASTVAQVAGALLGTLVDEDRNGVSVSVEHLVAEVARMLAADSEWAKGYQRPAGARSLAAEAIDHLEAFGLVSQAEGRVMARPAAARYAVKVTDARRTAVAPAPGAQPHAAPAQPSTGTLLEGP